MGLRVSCTAGEDRHSLSFTTPSTYIHRRNHRLQGLSWYHTELYHIGESVIQVKPSLLFFLQYSKHSISDFLLHRCAGNSPLNSCSSLRLSCLWVIFPDQCVSTQMPREAEASSQATSGFAAENEVYMPITNAWVRRLLDPLMNSTKQNQT